MTHTCNIIPLCLIHTVVFKRKRSIIYTGAYKTLESCPICTEAHRSESQVLIIIITEVKRLVSVSSPAQILLPDPVTFAASLALLLPL